MGFISVEGYEPKHLSFSTVSGYRDCGQRFYLQKVARKEQRPGLAGIGGNAVHTATEWYDQEVAPGAFDPEGSFCAAWDEEIEKRGKESPSYKVDDYVATGRASAAHGGKRGVSWWMENGPLMVQRWIDWRSGNGWSIWETPEGNPAIEVELNIILPGDIPVKMFIDRIMVTQTGQLVTVDIKTGREPETPEQLGLYAVGIEQTWGQMFRPDFGYWWDANKGTHSSPMELGMYTADYFAGVYAQAIAGINAGCFLAKPANRCATWCGVSRYCKAVAGDLSSGA